MYAHTHTQPHTHMYIHIGIQRQIGFSGHTAQRSAHTFFYFYFFLCFSRYSSTDWLLGPYSAAPCSPLMNLRQVPSSNTSDRVSPPLWYR